MSDYSTTQPSVQPAVEAPPTPQGLTTSRLAIASVVLAGLAVLTRFLPAISSTEINAAILAMEFLSEVGAVVTGHLALSRIKRGEATGRGLARTGLIIGYVVLALDLVGLLFAMVLVLFFASLFTNLF